MFEKGKLYKFFNEYSNLVIGRFVDAKDGFALFDNIKDVQNTEYVVHNKAFYNLAQLRFVVPMKSYTEEV